MSGVSFRISKEINVVTCELIRSLYNDFEAVYGHLLTCNQMSGFVSTYITVWIETLANSFLALEQHCLSRVVSKIQV